MGSGLGGADDIRQVTMLQAMIGEPGLRWAVTVLFGMSIAMYAYLTVAQHDRWTGRLTHLLHLTMSVAMVLMVWRVGLDLPAIGPALFFLVAGLWFVGVAVWASPASRQRLKTCYYAVMMAAMAWMYALMSGAVRGVSILPHSQPDSPVMDMPGMKLPSHDMPPATTAISWVSAANCIGVAAFAAVALYWSYRFVGERRMHRVPTTARVVWWEPLYQASTAAGTALMFDALVW
nr:DUF5134 domain-containing protein [Mycobacterium senriense]